MSFYTCVTTTPFNPPPPFFSLCPHVSVSSLLIQIKSWFLSRGADLRVCVTGRVWGSSRCAECDGTWALTSCCLLCTRPQGGSPTAITFFWERAGAAAAWSLTASPTQQDTPSLRPPVKIQAPGQQGKMWQQRCIIKEALKRHFNFCKNALLRLLSWLNLLYHNKKWLQKLLKRL